MSHNHPNQQSRKESIYNLLIKPKNCWSLQDSQQIVLNGMWSTPASAMDKPAIEVELTTLAMEIPIELLNWFLPALFARIFLQGNIQHAPNSSFLEHPFEHSFHLVAVKN
jgi:hypothetical protein